MNWQHRYEKIKIGDTVKCITPNDAPTPFGAGWSKDLIFKVADITTVAKMKVVWGGIHGYGVFMNCVIKQ